MDQKKANELYAKRVEAGSDFVLGRGETVQGAIDALVDAGGTVVIAPSTPDNVVVVRSVRGGLLGIKGNALWLAPVCCRL